MFFAIEQREIVRDENPGITFGSWLFLFLKTYFLETLTCRRLLGQVGKLLGQRWKELDEVQRTPYEVKAAEDKKRYTDEKANYNVNQHITKAIRFNQLLC